MIGDVQRFEMAEMAVDVMVHVFDAVPATIFPAGGGDLVGQLPQSWRHQVRQDDRPGDVRLGIDVEDVGPHRPVHMLDHVSAFGSCLVGSLEIAISASIRQPAPNQNAYLKPSSIVATAWGLDGGPCPAPEGIA